jgi:hypothetical protein
MFRRRVPCVFSACVARCSGVFSSRAAPFLYEGGGDITPHSILIYMENYYRDRN